MLIWDIGGVVMQMFDLILLKYGVCKSVCVVESLSYNLWCCVVIDKTKLPQVVLFIQEMVARLFC